MSKLFFCLLFITTSSLSFAAEEKSQTNLTKKKGELLMKTLLSDYRNRLASAKNAEEYAKEVDQMTDFLLEADAWTTAEVKLIRNRVASLKDFEMRDYLVKKYEKMIEDKSQNGIIAVFATAGCILSTGDHYRYCYSLLVFMLFPLPLEDGEISSDI